MAKCITFRRKVKNGPRLAKPVTVCFKSKKASPSKARRRKSVSSGSACRARDGKFMRCTGPAKGFALPGVGLLRNTGARNQGTLEDRYEIYVDAMIDLGMPYDDFDTWLNR